VGKKIIKVYLLEKWFSRLDTLKANITTTPTRLFYLILRGKLKFSTKEKGLTASEGSLVYFEKAEPHRIVEVTKEVEALLLKKLGAIKSE